MSRRMRQNPVLAAVSIALALALAACGGAQVGAPVAPTATVEAGQAPIAAAQSPAAFESLSPDQIVAAQEAVLGGIYNRLLPSVVHVQVAQRVGQGMQAPFGFQHPQTPDAPEGFYAQSEGSGFVWSDEGYIVTNHHVIDGAASVRVVFADGTEARAEVVGSDPHSDLAVLKVDVPAGRLVPADLGDSSVTRVGQLVLAIGNPFGQDFTMTSGIVSAVGRTIQSGNSKFSIPEVIQTDAAINPGNSGGPLIDRSGRVVGINTQILSQSGGNTGVGFAVPVNIAKRIVPVLIEKGSYEYAYLGIKGMPLASRVVEAMGLPAGTRGAQVVEVIQGSPADKAGLRGSGRTLQQDGIDYPVGGDVIIAVDGTAIVQMDDLIAYMVDSASPGDAMTLDVLREGGAKVTLEVILGARPQTG